MDLMPTADAVRAVRDRDGCGLREARRIALAGTMRTALTKAQTVDDLKPILTLLIDNLRP